MIPSEKYPDIAKQLLQKTASGNAQWEQDANVPTLFHLHLPHSTIDIFRAFPKNALDYITLTFTNKRDGKEVGEWVVDFTHDNWQLANDLYAVVSKDAFGWTEVMKDVEQFLADEQPNNVVPSST